MNKWKEKEMERNKRSRKKEMCQCYWPYLTNR